MSNVGSPVFSYENGKVLPAVPVLSQHGKPYLVFYRPNGKRVTSFPVQLEGEQFEEWMRQKQILLPAFDLKSAQSQGIIVGASASQRSPACLFVAQTQRPVKFLQDTAPRVFVNTRLHFGLCFYVAIVPAGTIMRLEDMEKSLFFAFFDGLQMQIISQYENWNDFSQAAKAARAGRRSTFVR